MMMMLRFVLAVTFLAFPCFGATSITAMITRVKQKYPDFHPNAIIDVGANVGEWSIEIREHFKDVKLLLLEGSPQRNATLAAAVTILGKDAEYRIGVLSATDGESVDYFTGGNTGNSMFRENSKHYVNDKPMKRITSTVDSLVQNSHLKNERIDIIKADVQGAELAVFKGARRTLSQATFVYFEGSTVEYNEGGACHYEVDAFLRSQGFFLYDLGVFMYNDAFKTMGLGQFDVMYVRPDSDRLPKYLVNSGVKFCGQGRKLPSADSDSMNAAPSASTDASSMQAEISSSQWKENGFAEIWFSGFLMGIAACIVVTTLGKKRVPSSTRFRPAIDA